VSEKSTFQKGKGSAPNRVMKVQSMDASALEQAAAATEGFKKKKSAEGPYSREVTRDEELWTTPGNFRYLATLKPCPESKKQSGGEHSRPRCFTRQCKVCGYFGNSGSDCKHTPRTDRGFLEHYKLDH
jgi:hypothetical protein